VKLRNALIALMIAALAAPSAFAAPEIDVPVVDAAPAMHGDVSCPNWASAATVGDFVALKTGETPAAQTQVRVLCTAEALHVAFICHEPAMDELVAQMSGRDAQVWGDDAVDLMLAPTGGVWMYHFIVNPDGVLWDGLHGLANIGGDVDLEGIEIATARGEDRWSVEMRIPFDAIRAAAHPGEIWGVNFGRERKAGEGGISSWALTDGFTNVQTLGVMRITGPEAPEGLTITSRGGASAACNEFGHNTFQVQAAAPAERSLDVALTVSADGREIGSRHATVAAGEERALSAEYTVPAAGEPVLQFAVAVDGAQVYASEVRALPAAPPQPRTWVVEDPLFRELLGDEPPGWASEGAMMWRHPLLAHVLRPTAVRLATEYVLEDAWEMFGDNRLIAVGGGQPQGETKEYMERYGVQYTAYISEPRDEWLLDPETMQDYLDRVEERLSQPHPHLFAIFAGDEHEEQAIRKGMELMADPPEGYDYIHEANREVMERFGGGKWGIPKGEADRNPYRRIAYLRWVNEKMRERARRLREVVKRLDPEMPIISTDPVGGVHGYEFSRQAPYYDIFTHQYLPRGQRWRQYLGFLSKVLADLTESEVWPCVHIENYAFATTPDEALEEMSQVIRNGGHGFHLYMPDTANAGKTLGDTRVTMFGSPRRHHTVMNIVRMTTRMPRPVYPDPGRVAVFYNDDCLQAEGYHAPGRTHWYRTEACYTFLGPIARSWFEFIDVGNVLDEGPLAERYDLIWVPTAKYQQPEVVDRLEQFVRDGGTLICADPTAFSTDLLGNDTGRRRVEIFGVEVGDRVEAQTLLPTVPWWSQGALEMHAPAQALKPVAPVMTMIEYDDGTPAVTARRLGQGLAIMWGTNPFQFSANEDPLWREWFTMWAEELGMQTGHDIWRFQYPQTAIWRAQPARGVCLTNNHVLWQEEVPHFPNNVVTGGSYSYSIAPDAMPEAIAQGPEISFEEGNLTDRRQSIRDEKTEPAGYKLYVNPDSRWMVSWERTEPVSVVFDLGGVYTVNQLRLWYRDQMPEVTVEGSLDAGSWQPLGDGSGPDALDGDVRELKVSLRHDLPVRYVRASFAERDEGRRLSLVEAELWGRDLP